MDEISDGPLVLLLDRPKAMSRGIGLRDEGLISVSRMKLDGVECCSSRFIPNKVVLFEELHERPKDFAKTSHKFAIIPSQSQK